MRQVDMDFKTHLLLRNGESVLIRPLNSSDKTRIVKALKYTSDKTLFQRFFSFKKGFQESELNYLTQFDGINHYALGAMEFGSEDGLAVARFVKDKDDPTKAEFSIVITDRYQGVGLGVEMLKLLSIAARQRGIKVFTAYVKVDNRSMLGLIKKYSSYKVIAREVDIIQIETPLFI